MRVGVIYSLSNACLSDVNLGKNYESSFISCVHYCNLQLLYVTKKLGAILVFCLKCKCVVESVFYLNTQKIVRFFTFGNTFALIGEVEKLATYNLFAVFTVNKKTI